MISLMKNFRKSHSPLAINVFLFFLTIIIPFLVIYSIILDIDVLSTNQTSLYFRLTFIAHSILKAFIIVPSLWIASVIIMRKQLKYIHLFYYLLFIFLSPVLVMLPFFFLNLLIGGEHLSNLELMIDLFPAPALFSLTWYFYFKFSSKAKDFINHQLPEKE